MLKASKQRQRYSIERYDLRNELRKSMNVQ